MNSEQQRQLKNHAVRFVFNGGAGIDLDASISAINGWDGWKAVRTPPSGAAVAYQITAPPSTADEVADQLDDAGVSVDLRRHIFSQWAGDDRAVIVVAGPDIAAAAVP